MCWPSRVWGYEQTGLKSRWWVMTEVLVLSDDDDDVFEPGAVRFFFSFS